MKAIAKDATVTLIGEGGIFVSALLFGVLTARWLGPEGKGHLGVFFGASGILVTALSLRFERSITYFLAGGRANFGSVVGGGIVAGAVAVCSFCLILWFFPTILSQYVFSGIPIGMVWSAVFLMVALYLRSLIASVLAGKKDFKLRSLFHSCAYFFDTAVAAVSLIIFKVSTWDLILILGVCDVVVASTVLALIVQSSGDHLSVRLGLQRRMYAFASAGFFSMLSELVTARLDIFLVNYFVGATEAGIYIVSISLANILSIGPTALRTVLMPYVASTSPASGSGTTRITRSAVMVLGILALTLLLLSWFLLEPVYGRAFSGSWWPFVILLPGTICWLVLGLLNAHIEGRGRPGLASLAFIVAGVSTILLDFVLIPRLGALGAAFASSISNILAALCGSAIYFRLAGEGMLKQFIPTIGDVRDLRRAICEFGTLITSSLGLVRKRFSKV